MTDDKVPGSTSRRNACVIHPQQGVKGFGRRSPAKGLARPPFQGLGHRGKVVRAVQAQVRALREVLAQRGVKLGDSYELVMTDGIKAGDQVITGQLQKLKPGAPVKAEKPN